MSKFLPPKPYEYVHAAKYEKPEARIITLNDFKEWYNDNIVPMFENAVEIHGKWDGTEWTVLDGAHHKGLLINIQPIQPESAEDILRELVRIDDCFQFGHIPPPADGLPGLVEKARKYLGSK